jgi:chloramphenicol O-acetyltransferase
LSPLAILLQVTIKPGIDKSIDKTIFTWGYAMEMPLQRRPLKIQETPIWSLYYLTACRTPSDPTIIWGTDVPVSGLDAYLKQVNAQSDVLISPAHVLIRAVGRCLIEHPEFNRRVVRRRLYTFKQVNILIPILGGSSGPEVCLVCTVDQKSLAQIAGEIWEHSQNLAKGKATCQRDERLFRFIPGFLRGMLFRHVLWSNNLFHWPVALWGHRMARAGTMINYLGHRGAPPMTMFKPSRFPNDACTLNITMGPSQPSALNGPTAPLIARADHRVVDAYKLGQFLGDLRRYMSNPALLDEPLP